MIGNTCFPFPMPVGRPRIAALPFQGKDLAAFAQQSSHCALHEVAQHDGP